ncbi:MAG: DUF6348 family protein [Acidobacteriota bacterium]
MDDCDDTGRSPRVVHLDVGFAFNGARDDTTIWDCASGWAEDRREAISTAVAAWMGTTAPALLTCLRQRFMLDAASFEPDDPFGIPGWHCLSGPYFILGWPDIDVMQRYVTDNPPLPRIVSALPAELGRELLNGVKLFVFAGPGAQPTCEVRVNGHRHERASKALAGLDWPRPPNMVMFRYFVLAVHRVPFSHGT